MTQYCDYSTFQFTQALPGATEPTERVFFSMDNVRCNDVKPQVKTETFEVEDDSDQNKNISVPWSAGLDFHELIKSNKRSLLNEKRYLSGARENGNAKNGTDDTASAVAIKH